MHVLAAPFCNYYLFQLCISGGFVSFNSPTQSGKHSLFEHLDAQMLASLVLFLILSPFFTLPPTRLKKLFAAVYTVWDPIFFDGWKCGNLQVLLPDVNLQLNNPSLHLPERSSALSEHVSS